MEATKILIVEDDYSAATYLKDLLVDIGYIVSNILQSGEDAVNFIKESSVDIILMDVELEGKLDGIETAKEISKISNPYIIYITALTDKKTFSRAKATFPENFLSKPFNKHQLLDILDQILGSKKETIIPTSFHQDFFFAKAKGVYKKYSIESIKYLQASGSSTDIFFNDKTISKITLSKNLKKTLSNLKTNIILRINRSYAINMNEIESIDNWHVKLFNIKETITVQENFRNDFNKLIKKL